MVVGQINVRKIIVFAIVLNQIQKTNNLMKNQRLHFELIFESIIHQSDGHLFFLSLSLSI